MNLYLVRHGQDDESVRGGWCQHGLLEEGVTQSQCLGDELSNISFDIIFSSDLNRAIETTRVILSYQNKTEVHYTSELREINNGLLSGMKHEEAEEKYPGLYYRTLDFDEKYPLGESPKEFYERVSQFFEKEIFNLKAENILIITHGGVINIVQHLLNNQIYSNKEVKYPIKTGSFVKLNK